MNIKVRKPYKRYLLCLDENETEILRTYAQSHNFTLSSMVRELTKKFLNGSL